MSLRGYLDSILLAFASKVGIKNFDMESLFTEGGREILYIASGGVPRDFLTLFLKGQEVAHRRASKAMDKRSIGEAARQYLEDTKRPNLAEDGAAEVGVLDDLLSKINDFALEDKKKTVFLVSQQDRNRLPELHDGLRGLADLRFIHLVDANTSATYGGRLRFEGYLIDAGMWVFPRPQGLEEVEFDRRDASGRRDELRNAPILNLSSLQELQV